MLVRNDDAVDAMEKVQLFCCRRKLAIIQGRDFTQPVQRAEDPAGEATDEADGRAQANKNRWRANGGAAGSVRYFDVNNFGSALDRFWREKEQGRERGRVR